MRERETNFQSKKYREENKNSMKVVGNKLILWKNLYPWMDEFFSPNLLQMILHIFDPLLGALPLVDASPLLEALCLIGLNYSDLFISELENIFILNLL